MSNEGAVFDANAITPIAGQPPFRLVPVIHDLLRTRYCVPGSVFLVEGVDSIPMSSSGRWQAVRLLLGDGLLCVQALLRGAMHRLVETGQVGVGCYVRAEEFTLTRRRLDGDDDGRTLVYLIVEDMVPVGWNEPYRDRWRAEQAAAAEELADEGDLDAEEANLEYDAAEVDRAQIGGFEELEDEVSLVPVPPHSQPDEADDADEDDDFEAFETVMAPPPLPKPTSTRPKASSTSTTTKPHPQPKHQHPVALPRDWHSPQQPLKLTTLRSIPHLPYKQNWSCNVLAIVASLSPVEPSHLPPHRQRVARIADPSTAKLVHLTVFLDPDAFDPAVGSAVLLVGVKNHHFDGGCLKKYASDARYGRWWFENPVELGWCDVAGIKAWWEERGGIEQK